MKQESSVLHKYPDYEVVIGIEVHVQLTTRTKIFCACANNTHATPNQNVCPICAGHPGMLPVLNEAVLENAIKAGLAINATIHSPSLFDRKHYFYPDLPKGYQITQQFLPICTDGFVSIFLEDGSEKKIRVKRIHIEEDAGKNSHLPQVGESLIDLNRAGTPLLEIVSEPDIRSAYEAREYLKNLRSIVQYLGICSGNMQEGAFRADTNISVRKKGTTQLGTKCELKNINSFKFIADAIEHEIERQIELILNGGTVKQETRLWDTKQKVTIPMRSKEEAADYRYFPEPDVPALYAPAEIIAHIKDHMPELPFAKIKRYIKDLGLSFYEASVLVEDKDVANYFEQAYAINPSKTIVNWILRDLLCFINDHKMEITKCPIDAKRLGKLTALIDNGSINNNSAKRIFEYMLTANDDPETIMNQYGLAQTASHDELEAIVKAVIHENAADFSEFKNGKDKLLGFFVGQIMKKSNGKANPKIIQELLLKHK